MSDKNKINESFKVGSGKIGGQNKPIEEGVDVPIKIIGINKTTKNNIPCLTFEYSQIDQVGRTSKIPNWMGNNKGFQSYVDILFYSGLSKKVGINLNESVTPKKLLASLDKAIKVLIGAKFLADVEHYEDKYQGKTFTKADIVNIRKFENSEPEEQTEDGFEGFDDSNDDNNNDEPEDEPKPKKKTKKKEKVVEEVAEETVEDSDDDDFLEDD